MASVLQVATIKDQGGNANAIEIANSSANVTINNLAAGTIGSAVTGFTGIKESDQWRLHTSFTGLATPISSNFFSNPSDTPSIMFFANDLIVLVRVTDSFDSLAGENKINSSLVSTLTSE